MNRALVLVFLLLGPSSAHAITVMPSVAVEDPSQCITTQALTNELAALLPPGRDHHAYAVGVLVQAAQDPDTATVLLTVEDSTGRAPALERSLNVPRAECADASRLLARIAAKAMDNAPRAESPAAAAPVSRPVLDATPARATRGTMASEVSMPAEWIHFKKKVVVTVTAYRYGSTASANELEEPVQGPFEKALAWEDFYRAVGRPDLAEVYQASVSRRVLLTVGGIAAMAGGTALGLMAAAALMAGSLLLLYTSATTARDPNSTQAPPSFTWGLGGLVASPVVGAVLMGVPLVAGLAVTMVGVLTKVQPVPLDEAKALAHEHNRKLQAGMPGSARSHP